MRPGQPRCGHAGAAALAMLVLASVGLAVPRTARVSAQSGEIALIRPGEAIGPVRLEMTQAQVRALSDRLPCEVAVAYAAGQASRLETNCGVAYQTAEGITVGLDGSRIRGIHGQPDLIVPSNSANTRADWLVYQGQGIGFRIIHADTGTLIQAISIFKGTGEPPPARRPALPPVAPPNVSN
ncbi:MAG: hypothetical protein QN178_02830 [Armatimonadota bacterium]|nr:hypothetical protein [Armatimonadota bacterium]